MTTISIVAESENTEHPLYHAAAGKRQSVGQTAGEALDKITAQLSAEESGTLVIVQNLRPDRFFNKAQQQRLTELMAQWRTARDSEAEFPAESQAELNALVETELRATALRAAAIHRESTQ